MPAKSAVAIDRIIADLDTIEAGGEGGTLDLGRGSSLHVSHLDKVFFPDDGITKGDVMRYYAWVSSYLLPLVQDRALSLKRFPNGIAGDFFFQQKAPHDLPPSVRAETLTSGTGEEQHRLVGGSLATLLYCAQLGAIEVNPWNARVQSLEHPDYTVIDLDPGPRAPFERIVEAALWIKDELDHNGLHAAIKTSGSRGIHIFIPLDVGTDEAVAERVSERLAVSVAEVHPQETTVQRGVKARGEAKIYLDYGQNARGKTVAAAYSVRPKPGATVSTPLLWEELTPGLDPHAFTILTLPDRIATVGDLWGEAMRRPNAGQAVTEM